MNLSKKDILNISPIITFSIIIIIYYKTVSPSIAGGDSGELVAEGCHLGTAHPPGYPLYTMLLYIITNYIPPYHSSTKAWKSNLFSSFCDSLAASIISLIINIICLKIYEYIQLKYNKKNDFYILIIIILSSILASITWALSPLIWQYASTAEVFALNNLLCSLLLYYLLQYFISLSFIYDYIINYNNNNINKGKKKIKNKGIKINNLLNNIYIGSFLSGLALCNQHTSILYIIPIILIILYNLKYYLYYNYNKIIYLSIFFFLGLLPYIYLPIGQIYNHQPGSWGDVTTLYGFIHHLRRGDYGSFQLYSGDVESESFIQQILTYFYDIYLKQTDHILPLFILFILIILIYYLNNIKNINNNFKCIIYLLLSLFILWLFYISIFHYLANLRLADPLLYGVQSRFWMQPNIIIFIFIGLGYFILFSLIYSIIILSYYNNNIFKKLYIILNIIITILFIYNQYNRSLYISDQSNTYYFNNYGKALLKSLPDNSLLLTNYDMQWTSMRYLKVCENYRPEVELLTLSIISFNWWKKKHYLYPRVNFPNNNYSKNRKILLDNGGFSFRQFLDANINNFDGGIYIGGHPSYTDDYEDYLDYYDMIPVGLLTQFIPKNKTIDLKEWKLKAYNSWENIQSELSILPSNDKYSLETWESTITRDYFDHIKETGAYLLEPIVESYKLENKDNKLLKGVNNWSEYEKFYYLIESVLWLETSIHYDNNFSTHVLKNLGLGYIHIIKQENNPDGSLKWEFPNNITNLLPLKNNIIEPDIYGHLYNHWYKEEIYQGNWKKWAIERFIWSWGEFLDRPESKNDVSYNTIKNIYLSIEEIAKKLP